MANLEADAATLTKLTELASQARGVELTTVAAPEGAKGVPAAIPALKIAGTNPQLSSVAALFESWRTKPAVKKGTAKALTLESFITLTNRHKTADSAVFADTNWQKPSLTAVIDYHEARNGGEPDNGKHSVAYEFPLSEEWQAWVKNNGEVMGQQDFAEFIENRIAELSAPTEDERIQWESDFATRVASPAELVKLSRGLQVNVEARVKNNVMLSSGEGQIAWEEEHRDANGQALKVPGMFCLAIAPFFMGEKARIPVRLRYRVVSGKVVWFYQIYRPDLAVTLRVRDDVAGVAEATLLPTFEATPEMAA
jgi:uncharacterized protein YfdQ (DUF2303 family)